MRRDLITYASQPRSVLKSQLPIGFGTPLCESLESYFERLLAAHDIQRKQLECLALPSRSCRRLEHFPGRRAA